MRQSTRPRTAVSCRRTRRTCPAASTARARRRASFSICTALSRPLLRRQPKTTTGWRFRRGAPGEARTCTPPCRRRSRVRCAFLRACRATRAAVRDPRPPPARRSQRQPAATGDRATRPRLSSCSRGCVLRLPQRRPTRSRVLARRRSQVLAELRRSVEKGLCQGAQFSVRRTHGEQMDLVVGHVRDGASGRQSNLAAGRAAARPRATHRPVCVRGRFRCGATSSPTG